MGNTIAEVFVVEKINGHWTYRKTIGSYKKTTEKLIELSTNKVFPGYMWTDGEFAARSIAESMEKRNAQE